MAVEADSAIPLNGYLQTSYLLMLITIVALLSVMVCGENEYGICKIARGPMLNLFRFKSSEKIF